jgi:serine/threonine-protein kinase
MFWVGAEPRLGALGWTGVLDRSGDVQNSGQTTNPVERQSPYAGTGVNYDSRVTLSFAS